MTVLSDFLPEIAGFRLGDIPAGRVGLALATLVLSWIAMTIVFRVLRKLGTRRRGFASSFSGRIARPAGILAFSLGAYGALRILPLTHWLAGAAGKGLLTACVSCAVWILFSSIDSLADLVAARRMRGDSLLDDRMLPLLRKSAKAAAAAVGAVFLIQSMGYPVGGILAGLGIGGLAVALAAQDTLAGVFASITLVLDRPFAVGDFVDIGGLQGTVEDVGLRSTRLRTPDRTLVSIPNKKLIDMSIDNWSGRGARRTVIPLGIDLSSPPGGIQELLGGLRSLLDRHPLVEKGSSSVHIAAIGESALDVECVFFLATIDYYEWLSLRSGLYLDALEVVTACGLELAYPTRTVRISSPPAGGTDTGQGSGRDSSAPA